MATFAELLPANRLKHKVAIKSSFVNIFLVRTVELAKTVLARNSARSYAATSLQEPPVAGAKRED
jgi:hypothetical protein